MKYILTLLVAVATSASAYAADYTQVQIGAGAMYYGLFERDQAFEDELKTEERTKPSISLQISGQIFESSKMLWFDMFAQQTAKSYAEFQEDGSDNIQTHEANFTIFGLGGRVYPFPNTLLKPYLKTGYFSGKIHIEETFRDGSASEEKENTTINETGYYVGGGLMKRINNKNSVSADYSAYKIDEIKNFQHNFQIGWVFHF